MLTTTYVLHACCVHVKLSLHTTTKYTWQQYMQQVNQQLCTQYICCNNILISFPRSPHVVCQQKNSVTFFKFSFGKKLNQKALQIGNLFIERIFLSFFHTSFPTVRPVLIEIRPVFYQDTFISIHQEVRKIIKCYVLRWYHL